LVAKNPAQKVRLRYEQAIHHVRLALGFGFITYSENADKLEQSAQAGIASYFGYAEKGWTEKAWNKTEEKADFSTLEDLTGIDLATFNKMKRKVGAAKLFDALRKADQSVVGNFDVALDGKLPVQINSVVKSATDIKLKQIADLQLLQEIFVGDKDDIAIRLKQTEYLNENTDPLGVGQDLVINTAVTNRLAHAGVTALMARGWEESYTNVEPFDNTDYKAANFLADRALTVKNNPYKASHLDQKKQIELRTLRFDWK
jgi:hypothetical protein